MHQTQLVFNLVKQIADIVIVSSLQSFILRYGFRTRDETQTDRQTDTCARRCLYLIGLLSNTLKLQQHQDSRFVFGAISKKGRRNDKIRDRDVLMEEERHILPAFVATPITYLHT